MSEKQIVSVEALPKVSFDEKQAKDIVKEFVTGYDLETAKKNPDIAKEDRAEINKRIKGVEEAGKELEKKVKKPVQDLRKEMKSVLQQAYTLRDELDAIVKGKEKEEKQKIQEDLMDTDEWLRYEEYKVFPAEALKLSLSHKKRREILSTQNEGIAVDLQAIRGVLRHSIIPERQHEYYFELYKSGYSSGDVLSHIEHDAAMLEDYRDYLLRDRSSDEKDEHHIMRILVGSQGDIVEVYRFAKKKNVAIKKVDPEYKGNDIE